MNYKPTAFDPRGLGSGNASGDKNEYVIYPTPTSEHTMCSADANNAGHYSGYVCSGCGTWVPLNTTHNCVSFGQSKVQVWPTVEWLILRELQRISVALETISEKIPGSTNPPEMETQEAPQCQAPSLPLSQNS